jgi:hypothetical protein
MKFICLYCVISWKFVVLSFVFFLFFLKLHKPYSLPTLLRRSFINKGAYFFFCYCESFRWWWVDYWLLWVCININFVTCTHFMSICFKILSFSQSYFCKWKKSTLLMWWYVFDFISLRFQGKTRHGNITLVIAFWLCTYTNCLSPLIMTTKNKCEAYLHIITLRWLTMLSFMHMWSLAHEMPTMEIPWHYITL